MTPPFGDPPCTIRPSLARRGRARTYDPATGTYRLDYDAADRRIGLAYPNGVTTEHEYDRASRLTLLLTRNPQGEVLDGCHYTYDPVGNRTSMRSLRDDVFHEYTYDAVDRLTRWQRGAERFEAYTYDAVGNRQRLEDERGTITYTYDDANRLLEELRTLTVGGQTTTTYQWDPNGNLLEEAVSTGSVTTYTWDALNRLTRIDGPTGTHTYGYDPNGIRVRETNDGETTRFLHAAEDILATYETDQPDQPGQLATYFTHGPGIDEPWAQAQPGDTENPLAYLHRDGLGSVTALSTPEAQLRGTATYAAFGSVEDSTGLQTRYGFTSRELDPTGQMYYRARYYQTDLGRFTAPDPARSLFVAPNFLNQYHYGESSPLNNVDPTGTITVTSSGVRGALALIYFAIAFWQLMSLGQLWLEWTSRGSEFSQVYRRAILFEAGFLVGIAIIYAKIGWTLLTGKIKLSEKISRNSGSLWEMIKGYRSEIGTLVIWAAIPSACIAWTFNRIKNQRASLATVAFCVIGFAGFIDVLGRRGLL